MKSELAKNLKTVLDNMSQEQFNKEWGDIEKQGYPRVDLFITNLENYVKQMIDSNAEYDKKPLRKILKRINSYETTRNIQRLNGR